MGEIRLAIAMLRQAIAAGVVSFGWMEQDPDLNPLREDPEFIELMPNRPEEGPRI